MADSSQTELTLASLRRRGARKRAPAPGASDLQPDLFGSLPEAFPAASLEIASDLGGRRSTRPMDPVLALAPIDLAVPNGAVHGIDSARALRPASRALAPQLPATQALTPSPAPGMVPAAAAPQPDFLHDPDYLDPIAEPAIGPDVPPQRWSVSGLVAHVRALVERGYGQVSVEGEISNWRPAGSGHCYFTLKDAGAQLSAVIFRRQASLVRFRPRDGDAVRLHGQLSVYESRGQMQIIVEWMEQIGFGAVLAALQRLKERLRSEGLFDRKRALPPFPRCIGVVTSLQGAALRDIVKVCRRRHASVQLLIYPAAVQGPNCAAEIAAGLAWFSTHPHHAEVVLVARGGGSWEDLHGFDDEGVVRAIAACPLPVITGLGHATDSTLADLAADVCAPTPSAAAELLTAAQHRVEDRVNQLNERLRRAGSFELLRARQRLIRLRADDALRRSAENVNRRGQHVDELGFRSARAQRDRLSQADVRLRTLGNRLQANSPAAQLGRVQRRLEAVQLRLVAAAAKRTDEKARRLERGTHHLQAMSPLRVLERGYALVYGPDGRLLRAANAAQPGEQITARLAEGTLTAQIVG